MRKFLTTCLILIGIAALIALAMPELVVILGLIGLLLGLVLTPFLWGCIFAICWWGAKAFYGGTRRAVAAAALLTMAVAVAIPGATRVAGDLAYRLSMRPDLVPARRIPVRGDVRLDRPGKRWDNINSQGVAGLRGFACDNLCVALLFAPGVTSVTVDDSDHFSAREHRDGSGGFDIEARTYRLLPKARCRGRGLRPDLEGRAGLFPASLEGGSALNAQWNLRFANDVCLVRSRPIGNRDVLIRQGRYGDNLRAGSDWGFGFTGPEIDYVEIRNAVGNTLLRRFRSAVSVLGPILYVGSRGGIENFRFGWGRQTIANTSDGAVDLMRELDAHTDIVGRARSVDLLPAVRAQLAKAVADPSLTPASPDFQVIETYLDRLPNPLPPQDLDLVAKLVRDDRIGYYPSLYKLAALPKAQQRVIEQGFVQRALTTADPERLAHGNANVLLAKMPPGSFSRLRADERRLLDLPDRRWALYALAGRLDEGGPENVPLILRLIREHSVARRASIDAARAHSDGRLPAGFEAQNDTVRFARSALCRMGPAAAAALQPLKQMIDSRVIDPDELSGHNGVDWNLTLARLGEPLAHLKKPPALAGTEEAHRAWLGEHLATFAPARDC